MPRNKCRTIFSNKTVLAILMGVAAGILAATFFFSRSRSPESAPSAPVTTNSASGSPVSSAARDGMSPESKTSPGASEAPKPAVSRTPETLAKLKILHEILDSRNDNDPRLDRELRGLSPNAKAALREEYRDLKKEDRNGRGTIVFLIGREIDSEGDLEFLRQVLAESPCLSMTDCSRDMVAARGADAHQDIGIEATLAYPQLVVLHSLDRFLEMASRDLSPALRDAAWKIVIEAKNSPIPLLARKAAELEKKLEKARAS